MTATPASETVTLNDGRTLCFARYGAPGGKPVIYLHGAGSSRIDGEHFDAHARAAGLQVIATDRPGCGGSSPDPRRNTSDYGYSSYAEDLRQLADALGLSRFVVAGQSNGAAFAMAAAARLGERVVAAIPINSTTPVHDPLARRASPLTVRFAYFLMGLGLVSAEAGVRRFAKTGDGILQRAARESLRQQGSGYIAQEVRLAGHAWDYDHAAVVQPVEIFSGLKDGNHGYAPIWAQRLPTGRLHVIPGGHADYGAPESARKIVAAMAAAFEGART